MKPYLKFKIPCKPIAKKRPRFARRGKSVTTYNDQETEEGKFMWHLMRQLPDGFKPFEKGVPLFLDCLFVMPRPKGHYGTGKNSGILKPSAPEHHVVKPDKDNLEKFVMDCASGIIWHDDNQVVRGRQQKVYGEEPRTLIFVNKLS